MNISKKFTGRDWAYTLLDDPFMARVMEKEDFETMTNEDWEWLIKKDKKFKKIKEELIKRFSGIKVKKFKKPMKIRRKAPKIKKAREIPEKLEPLVKKARKYKSVKGKVPSIIEIHKKTISKKTHLGPLFYSLIRDGKMYSTDFSIYTMTIAPKGYKDGIYEIIGNELVKREINEEDYLDVIDVFEKAKKSIDAEVVLEYDYNFMKRHIKMVAESNNNYPGIVGIHIYAEKNGKTYCVSTDIIYLVWTKLKSKATKEFDTIIPVQAFKVLSLYKGINESMLFQTGEKWSILKHITNDGYDTIIIANNIQETYPTFWRVFPEEYIGTYIYDKNELVFALKKLKPFLNQTMSKEKAIYINFKENKVFVEDSGVDIYKEMRVHFKKISQNLDPKKMYTGILCMPLTVEEPDHECDITFAFPRLLFIAQSYKSIPNGIVSIAGKKRAALFGDKY